MKGVIKSLLTLLFTVATGLYRVNKLYCDFITFLP